MSKFKQIRLPVREYTYKQVSYHNTCTTLIFFLRVFFFFFWVMDFCLMPVFSNLYGQEYDQLTKKEDTVRRAGNDRIFWIFIIILILLILLILLIMLCCCWRYLLRQVEASPSHHLSLIWASRLARKLFIHALVAHFISLFFLGMRSVEIVGPRSSLPSNETNNYLI